MMLNNLTSNHQIEARNLSYSQFLQELSDGAVQEVTIQNETIKGVRSDGSHFETYDPGDPGLVGDLLKKNVNIRAKPPEEPSIFMQLVAAWLPFLLLAGIWIWFMRRSSGGGGGAGGIFNFGKSRARQHVEGEVKVTLARCRWRGGGQGGGWRTGRFPAQPAEVLQSWRSYSARRSDGRSPRHRQDPAGPRHRRRGQGALLQHLRFRFRRDVRRRRRLAGA